MLLYVITVIIALIAAYFCGAIPVGLIVGKVTGDIDIRQHGSGNTGTTNALRTMGWGPGLLVFAGDVFKGALGCLLVSLAVSFSSIQALMSAESLIQDLSLYGLAGTADGLTAAQAAAAIDPLANALAFSGSNYILEIPMALGVVACVLGHMFSPFMGFKGGKGVATALGTLIVVIPAPALCAFAVFGVAVLIFRIVSVGSLAGVIALPIFTAIFFSNSPTYIVLTILIAIIVILAHRKNIIRLAKGEEPRFSAGKKKD